MSAMSLQTTSQHFRVKFRIASRPIATEGNKWTTEWKKGAQNDNPISIFNLHHMMQSHKLFWNCCVQSNIFSSKGKKTTHKKKNWEKHQCGNGGKKRKQENQREKHKAMCFTAYLKLGRYEYSRDLKHIWSGTVQVMERTGQQWKRMAFWFTHSTTHKTTIIEIGKKTEKKNIYTFQNKTRNRYKYIW